jgi:hypothetical protein
MASSNDGNKKYPEIAKCLQGVKSPLCKNYWAPQQSSSCSLFWYYSVTTPKGMGKSRIVLRGNLMVLGTAPVYFGDSFLVTFGFLYIHTHTHFFFDGPGFEFRALCLQSRYSTNWPTPPVYFALVILEMECHKLFAWAGLEPESSQSQSPK